MGMNVYKLVIACLIAECCSQSLFPSHEGCSQQYDDIDDAGKCTHTVYCKEQISFQYTRDDRCNNLIYVPDSGGNYDPINVVFKHNQIYEYVPKFGNYMVGRTIYSLDLSDNIYTDNPHLNEMENLALLIMSRCSLSTAKLSNINSFPALTDLDYSENTIDNILVLPGEHAFRTLKNLNISHNYLVNIPEAIFDSFDNLESLDLSHNFLDTLDVMTFDGIRKLLYLDLSNNRITEIDASLRRFHYLVKLDLGHNMLQTLKANNFGKLINLQEIKLDSNEIHTIEGNVFEDTISLTTIDLRDNYLENIDQAVFINATKLTTVNLSRNKIKILPKNVFKGKTIFSFTIEGNNLEGALVRGLFEGLTMVIKLDLSAQHLTAIENNAFTGLPNLKTLLLNNNDVQLLSNYAFKGLQNLNFLDLSYNNIEYIDIAAEDLVSLQILSLRYNKISHIAGNTFTALASLNFLDLSHNNISHLGSNIFQTLQSLLDFKISDNPLCGSLEEKTFDGLKFLPSLDISGTLINTINNGSFMGMSDLRELNVSHCNITNLHHNALSYMTNIRTIDLSFNQIRIFDVNTTDLRDLNILKLNNNMLQIISQTTFNGMRALTMVILSYNNIQTIKKEAFDTLEDLRCLDISYNQDIKFDVALVSKAQNLGTLFLSGTKSEVSFDNISGIPVAKLEMAYSNIQNISHLNLHKLHRLETLVISNNALSKLEVGALSNLTTLKKLDLSYNNLTFIQPGSFKDNIYLNLLNVSHNKLTEINYGFFRGLLYLEILDLSYNKIKNLHRARFYDVEHLSTLIVDHNEINFVSEDEFLGTRLSKLSIGGNLLPCEILAAMDKNSYHFSITAINLDDTQENVKGVTCNRENRNLNSKLTAATAEHDKLLLDIRNVLFNISKAPIIRQRDIATHNDSLYFANLSEQQSFLNLKLSSISNFTAALVNLNNYTHGDYNYLGNITEQLRNLYQSNLQMINSIKNLPLVPNITSNTDTGTNVLLEKILRVLTSKQTVPSSINKLMPYSKNISSDNYISYINKIKQDLEDTLAIEKQNVMDLNEKMDKLNSRIDSSTLTTRSVHEKLVSSNVNTQKSSMFTEICVGLILVIIVGFILFKAYKSKLYTPSGRSITSSTRHITEAMENSHL